MIAAKRAKSAKATGAVEKASSAGAVAPAKGKQEKGLVQLVDCPNAKHKAFAGTTSEAFNTTTLNQAVNTVWKGASPDAELRNMLIGSAAGAMMNIAPKDAIEGMLAAQLVATHNASMECYRRAMLPDQSFLGRETNLSQANRLVRSYAALVSALDKHRGKGQQTVRVEHVHVYQGGQAIVGHVGPGDRITAENSLPVGLLPQGVSENDD